LRWSAAVHRWRHRIPPTFRRAPPILLNGAATLADRIHPLAVMVEDERFVFRHMEMLSGLPRDIPLMLSSAVLRAMVELDSRVLTGRPIALIDNLTKPVNHPRRKLTDPVLGAE
jgi:hypothetical protein